MINQRQPTYPGREPVHTSRATSVRKLRPVPIRPSEDCEQLLHWREVILLDGSLIIAPILWLRR